MFLYTVLFQSSIKNIIFKKKTKFPLCILQHQTDEGSGD